MKLYSVTANTQRRYIITNVRVHAENENTARVIAYRHILDYKDTYNYKPNLYLKITVKEIKEEK